MKCLLSALKIFLGKCSSKLLRLFGLHWTSRGGGGGGVKWCKSEGVKDKLTHHSYIFFGLSGGGGGCKSWGEKEGKVCLNGDWAWLRTPSSTRRSNKYGKRNKKPTAISISQQLTVFSNGNYGSISSKFLAQQFDYHRVLSSKLAQGNPGFTASFC